MRTESLSYLVIALLIALPAKLGGEVTQATRASADERLSAFEEYVDREWPGKSYQHSITAESVRLLVEAIEGAGNELDHPDADLKPRLSRMRTAATEFRDGNANDPQQTKRLQQLFLAAADVMDRLALAARERDEVVRRLAAMRRSAGSLELARPLPRQPDVIERFFRQAGEVLRSLMH